MLEFRYLEKIYKEVFNVDVIKNENCSLISDYYDYEAIDIFYFLYLISEHYNIDIQRFFDIMDDLSYKKISELVKSFEKE